MKLHLLLTILVTTTVLITAQDRESVSHSAKSDTAVVKGAAAVKSAKEDPEALTAQNQSNAPGDLAATARIRKKIVARDDFSVAAKNIRVITAGGKVTLAGQVASEFEMESLMTIAREETGENTVTNRLSVRDNAGDKTTEKNTEADKNALRNADRNTKKAVNETN